MIDTLRRLTRLAEIKSNQVWGRPRPGVSSCGAIPKYMVVPRVISLSIITILAFSVSAIEICSLILRMMIAYFNLVLVSLVLRLVQVANYPLYIIGGSPRWLSRLTSLTKRRRSGG